MVDREEKFMSAACERETSVCERDVASDEREERGVALRALSGGSRAPCGSSAGVGDFAAAGADTGEGSFGGGAARSLARDRDESDGELVRESSPVTRAGPGTGAGGGGGDGTGVVREELFSSMSAGGCGGTVGTGLRVRELCALDLEREEGSSTAAPLSSSTDFRCAITSAATSAAAAAAASCSLPGVGDRRGETRASSGGLGDFFGGNGSRGLADFLGIGECGRDAAFLGVAGFGSGSASSSVAREFHYDYQLTLIEMHASSVLVSS